MPTAAEPVTTRQRAFLEQHGIPWTAVEAHGVQLDGVHIVAPNGKPDHPWTAGARMTAAAGDFVRMVLPYPDEATRDAATKARNEDWRETVGPEAAAIWDRLLGQ